MMVLLMHHGSVDYSCPDKVFRVARKRLQALASMRSCRKPDQYPGELNLYAVCPSCGGLNVARDPETQKVLFPGKS